MPAATEEPLVLFKTLLLLFLAGKIRNSWKHQARCGNVSVNSKYGYSVDNVIVVGEPENIFVRSDILEDNVIVGKLIYIDETNDNIDNYIEVIDENNYNVQEKINKIKLERDIERNKILSKLKDEIEKKKIELFNEMKYENITVDIKS